ncbi:hypothetical protein C8Q75DRAFT_733034 [Abortiporus biennis]|nr:hypothetical protein C8Q75DRAFT_733034 [Abortiporus biennis]
MNVKTAAGKKTQEYVQYCTSGPKKILNPVHDRPRAADQEDAGGWPGTRESEVIGQNSFFVRIYVVVLISELRIVYKSRLDRIDVLRDSGAGKLVILWLSIIEELGQTSEETIAHYSSTIIGTGQDYRPDPSMRRCRHKWQKKILRHPTRYMSCDVGDLVKMLVTVTVNYLLHSRSYRTPLSVSVPLSGNRGNRLDSIEGDFLFSGSVSTVGTESMDYDLALSTVSPIKLRVNLIHFGKIGVVQFVEGEEEERAWQQCCTEGGKDDEEYTREFEDTAEEHY